MNQDQKKRVQKIIRALEPALADLESIESEIRSAYDDLSAKAQESAKGELMQEDAECIERAAESLQSAIDEATTALDDK